MYSTGDVGLNPSDLTGAAQTQYPPIIPEALPSSEQPVEDPYTDATLAVRRGQY